MTQQGKHITKPPGNQKKQQGPKKKKRKLGQTPYSIHSVTLNSSLATCVTWSQRAEQLLLSSQKMIAGWDCAPPELLWPAAFTHNKWNTAIPDKVAWCIGPLLSWHSPYLPCRAKVFQAEWRVTAIRHCSTQSPLAVSLTLTTPRG